MASAASVAFEDFESGLMDMARAHSPAPVEYKWYMWTLWGPRGECVAYEAVAPWEVRAEELAPSVVAWYLYDPRTGQRQALEAPRVPFVPVRVRKTLVDEDPEPAPEAAPAPAPAPSPIPCTPFLPPTPAPTPPAFCVSTPLPFYPSYVPDTPFSPSQFLEPMNEMIAAC
eukprot:tig00000459_g1150.t1